MGPDGINRPGFFLFLEFMRITIGAGKVAAAIGNGFGSFPARKGIFPHKKHSRLTTCNSLLTQLTWSDPKFEFI